MLPTRCDATVANDYELNPNKPSVLIKRYSLFCYHSGRKLLGLAIRKHLVYQRPYQDCLEKKSRLEKSSCFSQYVHSPSQASIKELGWCASRFWSDKLPNRNLGIIVLQLMKSRKLFLSVLGWGKVPVGSSWYIVIQLCNFALLLLSVSNLQDPRKSRVRSKENGGLQIVARLKTYFYLLFLSLTFRMSTVPFPFIPLYAAANGFWILHRN